MQANLNSRITIKDEDAFCYHIKCRTVIVNPKDQRHPIERPRMLILEPDNYNRYFGKNIPEKQREENAKTMNIENLELVHDPTIERTARVEIPKSAEQQFLENKKATIKSPMKGRKLNK